jgi:DNA-directed RNA polymerase specialized sigma24 family protein
MTELDYNSRGAPPTFCSQAKSSLTTKNSQSDNDHEDASSDNQDATAKDTLESPVNGSDELNSPPKDTKWSLTSEPFEKLLAAFSPDRNEAGKLYLRKFLKVSRFFEWNRCDDPESLANETLDRVARKIDEGTVIFNLNGYINKVARIILMEYWDRLKRLPLVDESLGENVPAPEPEDPDLNDSKSVRRWLCLDLCLDGLPVKSRSLLEEYFSEDGGAKIELRRELAKKLGIGLNALRIRVCRILKLLEECLDRCCKQHS